MKIHLLLLSLLFTCIGNAQLIIYEYCFDQVTNCAWYNMSDPEPIITINGGSNPNNNWQIGVPQKTTLSSAFSSPNVIITDLANTYATNDTSQFTISSTAIQASNSVNWANFNLKFNFFVDSDTLVDHGTIEFSPDNGATWIDLIDDPNYAGYLEWETNQTMGNIPVLSGSSNGWVEARVYMENLGSLLAIQPGSNFIWRFGFISDAVQNNRDGLMFDNIYIEITPPIGLEENDLETEKKLVKIVDVFGREIVPNSTTPMIYIYNDGSTKKIIQID